MCPEGLALQRNDQGDFANFSNTKTANDLVEADKFLAWRIGGSIGDAHEVGRQGLILRNDFPEVLKV